MVQVTEKNFHDPAKKVDNKNDRVFSLFAHGNSKFIQRENQDKTVDEFYTPSELITALSANTDFKNAVEKKENITLVLFSCNTGATTYEENGKVLVDENPIAKRISKDYPFITVVAPNSYVMFGTDKNGEGAVKGLSSSVDAPAWVTFKNGVKVKSDPDNNAKNGYSIFKNGEEIIISK